MRKVDADQVHLEPQVVMTMEASENLTAPQEGLLKVPLPMVVEMTVEEEAMIVIAENQQTTKIIEETGEVHQDMEVVAEHPAVITGAETREEGDGHAFAA